MNIRDYRSLESVSVGRNNNLDLIRFLCAIIVILSHSFPISGDVRWREPLRSLSNGQMSLGELAVAVFFFYGGFLVCRSMYRLKTFRAYFTARIQRIFPELILVCFTLAFIAGPILTELSATEYFKDAGTYKYMLNGLLVLRHDLPGVFVHNAFGRTVNGSLWTLPVEFLCYVMCFLLYKMNLLEKKNIKWTVPMFVCGCIAVKFVSKRIPILEAVIQPVSMFYIGMVYFKCRSRIRMYWVLCLGSVLGLAIGILMGLLQYAIILFLPYLLAYIGFATKIKFSNFARHGEISYGIYLCAFPVQQALCQVWEGRMNPWLNFMLAVPIAIILGFICCRTTEKILVKYMKKTEKERQK